MTLSERIARLEAGSGPNQIDRELRAIARQLLYAERKASERPGWIDAETNLPRVLNEQTA